MVYRHQYPLKSQFEQKIDEINDLVTENKRLTNEFMERMDKLCQRMTEIKAKMVQPCDDHLSEEKIITFTSPERSDRIEV